MHCMFKERIRFFPSQQGIFKNLVIKLGSKQLISVFEVGTVYISITTHVCQPQWPLLPPL